MTILLIHEDEEGMRNLYPVAALAEAQADMAKARAAFQAREAPNGTEWKELHAIAPPQNGFLAAGADLDRLSAVVEAHLPRIRDFGVGQEPAAPHYRRETDAHCYGFGDDVFVKFELAEGRLAAIWFDAMTDDPARLQALRRALQAIDGLAPSIIADYWLEAVGAVGDGRFMSRYFAALGLEQS